jgi:hypothetical protein
MLARGAVATSLRPCWALRQSPAWSTPRTWRPRASPPTAFCGCTICLPLASSSVHGQPSVLATRVALELLKTKPKRMLARVARSQRRTLSGRQSHRPLHSHMGKERTLTRIVRARDQCVGHSRPARLAQTASALDTDSQSAGHRQPVRCTQTASALHAHGPRVKHTRPARRTYTASTTRQAHMASAQSCGVIAGTQG